MRLLAIRWRCKHSGPPLAAASIAFALLTRTIDVWWALMWLALGLALIVSPKARPQPLVFGLLVCFLLFQALGIVWTQDQHLWAINHTLWVAPFLGFYFLRSHVAAVLRWLAYFYAVPALAIYAEAAITLTRADGIALTKNAAGGAMAVAATVVASGHWAGAYFFLGAAALTGSRTGLAVAVVCTLGVWISQKRARASLVLVGALAAIVGLAFAVRPDYLVHSGVPRERLGEYFVREIKLRHVMSEPVRVRPFGPVASDGLHNTAIRQAVEIGVPAAALWLGLTGWALWRRPRFTPVWWVLGALALISMNDYYVWLGQLAPLWWLLVGRSQVSTSLYRRLARRFPAGARVDGPPGERTVALRAR